MFFKTNRVRTRKGIGELFGNIKIWNEILEA